MEIQKGKGNKLIAASELSGKEVDFGEVGLAEAILCVSPLLSKKEAKEQHFMQVSQGELYCLEELNLA